MCADRINRRDLIIETAAELFRENGYSATSVRQIAEAVGVTEAALYYHFKDGKRELLRTVFQSQMPNLAVIIGDCEGCQSLSDLIRCVSTEVQKVGRMAMEKFRWIIAEFPRLSEQERAEFYEMHIEYQNLLTAQITKLIDKPELAHHLALMLICTQLGYGQLFWNLGMENVVDFSSDDLIETMIYLLEK